MWTAAAELPRRHVQVDGEVSPIAAADGQGTGAEGARRVCCHGGPGMNTPLLPHASSSLLWPGVLAFLQMVVLNKILSRSA